MVSFYYLSAILGIIGFIIGICGVGTYATLYFDRDYNCIEQYVSLQKKTDIICLIHKTFILFFSIFLVFYGFGNLGNNNIDFTKYYIVMFFFLGVNFVVNEILVKKLKLEQVRNEIQHQWTSEKYISTNHDHEVNLYRACKTILEDYKAENITMLIGLFIVIL